MISFIAGILLKFLTGGIDAVRGTRSAGTSIPIEAMMKTLVEEEVGKDRTRVIESFETHLRRNFTPKSVKNNSDIIESLLASLVSLGESICEVVPHSTISTGVERERKNGVDVIYGHLGWEVDNQSPVVYSICMDLLKDGFIFRADSKTFVISTEVIK
jgi:hypothetical protein